MKKMYESPVAELIDLAALECIALLPGDPENSRSVTSEGNTNTPGFSSTVSTDPAEDDWWN